MARRPFRLFAGGVGSSGWSLRWYASYATPEAALAAGRRLLQDTIDRKKGRWAWRVSCGSWTAAVSDNCDAILEPDPRAIRITEVTS